MSNKNVSSLLSYLNDLGFGSSPIFQQRIEEEISNQSINFHLYTEAFFDEYTKMEAKLYFFRTGQADQHLLERYQTSLLDLEDQRIRRSQTFYVEDGLGITFKEAFNLLQERSVYKDVMSPEGNYKAWFRLDFREKDLHDNYMVRQYGLRYGYDLEKVLTAYPIRELGNEATRVGLYRSLETGNLQPVIFDKPTKSEKMFIEANPMFKTINIYSANVMATKKIGGGPMLSTGGNRG